MQIELPFPPQRILLIKPSAVGDVVHALPVLNLIRKRWPAASISWLVTPGCAGLLQNHPQIDHVILFERQRYATGWRDPRALRELLQLKRDLRQQKFDLVIDLQGLFRSGWLTWQTKAPVRVGFANAREFAWLGYTHRVPVEDVEQHAVDRYLSVAKLLRCGDGTVEFVFSTSDADRASAAELAGGEPYALLFPGTNWATKRWPIGYFAALVEPLQKQFGLKCLVGGSSGETQLAAQIRGAKNLAGKTNLKQLTALIEKASLVISNDSGPMHIAAALNRPLVAMFGPTNPSRTGPYGPEESVVRVDIPCSPCYSRKCSHQSCLNWLTAESVLLAAKKEIAYCQPFKNSATVDMPHPPPRPRLNSETADAG